VELAWSGGHQVRFPGLRMVPTSFPMRHYLFLSPAHAVRKYVQQTYDPAELALGWHRARSRLRAEDVVLQDEAELRLYTSDDRLDASSPLRRHPLRPGPPTNSRKGSTGHSSLTPALGFSSVMPPLMPAPQKATIDALPLCHDLGPLRPLGTVESRRSVTQSRFAQIQQALDQAEYHRHDVLYTVFQRRLPNASFRAPSFIVDAGAYTGFSVYLAQQYPHARIIAIEPVQSNYELP
jgi:hypothetical protein